MAKVYLVTEGSYSDYHVVAAFSTYELAAAFNAWRDGDAEIEEYELDVDRPLMREGHHAYRVWMWRDGGSETMCWSPDKPVPTEYGFHYSLREGKGRDHHEHELVLTVTAKSEEHAVKIANETRTQLIANGQWPEE